MDHKIVVNVFATIISRRSKMGYYTLHNIVLQDILPTPSLMYSLFESNKKAQIQRQFPSSMVYWVPKKNENGFAQIGSLDFPSNTHFPSNRNRL